MQKIVLGGVVLFSGLFLGACIPGLTTESEVTPSPETEMMIEEESMMSPSPDAMMEEDGLGGSEVMMEGEAKTEAEVLMEKDAMMEKDTTSY